MRRPLSRRPLAGTAPPRTAPTPPSTDPQQPVFRTGINFVRVDVIVTDKNGNPVNDLKPGDFEITEQNQPQKVETFKLISLDGGLIPAPTDRRRQIRTDTDEESEAARDDVRLFALFLDDYHVRRETSMSARSQLARFVETQLGPSDMIGVMYPLEPIAAVRMTRNHDAIVKGHSAVPRPQVRLHAEERVRGEDRVLPDRNGRTNPQSDFDVGDQVADRPHGRA